jgi:hypothetical protein
MVRWSARLCAVHDSDAWLSDMGLRWVSSASATPTGKSAHRSTVIRIETLPAEDGDCLWVEWRHEGRWRRLLVDGGRPARSPRTGPLHARLSAQPVADRGFDLVVCSHYDLDHVGGLLELFAAPPTGFTAADVWFNGRHHLAPDLLGPRQGDMLSELLHRRTGPWNAAFDGQAVVVSDDGPPPIVRLPGLTLTLLSPTWRQLGRLRRSWPEHPARPVPADVLGDPDHGVPLAEIDIAAYSPDPSPANGSSIAFVAEDAEGGRVLFGADAHAEVLAASLRRWSAAPAARVDLCKVPHHGSAHNVSIDLIRALDCRNWLFSTNGARFAHPSRRAVARIIRNCRRPVLWFNYRSATTGEYGRASVQTEHGFAAAFPEPGRTLRLIVADGVVSEA